MYKKIAAAVIVMVILIIVGFFTYQSYVNTQAQSMNRKGMELQNEGNYRDALNFFDTALEIKPDFPEAHYNRGITMIYLDRYSEGAEEVESACLDLHPIHSIDKNGSPIVYPPGCDPKYLLEISPGIRPVQLQEQLREAEGVIAEVNERNKMIQVINSMCITVRSD